MEDRERLQEQLDTEARNWGYRDYQEYLSEATTMENNTIVEKYYSALVENDYDYGLGDAIKQFDSEVERARDQADFKKELETEEKLKAFADNIKGKVRVNKLPGLDWVAPYYFVDIFTDGEYPEVYIITKDRGVINMPVKIGTESGKTFPRFVFKKAGYGGGSTSVATRDFNQAVDEYVKGNK